MAGFPHTAATDHRAIERHRTAGTHLKCAVRLAAAFGLAMLALLPADPALAEVLFSDSFESGNGSGWSFGGHTRTGYASTHCQDGSYCGTQTLAGGSCDQSVFWSEVINYSGEHFYVKAWWMFPAGYTFSMGSGCQQAHEHKAIIIESPVGQGRCFLNFRGSAARIAFICEGTGEDYWSYGTPTSMAADGQWHSVELYIRRAPGIDGEVRSWYDGVEFLNESRKICMTTCAAISEVKIGAYVNYPPSQTQTFYVDNVTMSTDRISGADGGVGAGSGGSGSSSGGSSENPSDSGGSVGGVPTDATCSTQGSGVLLCDGFEGDLLAGWDDVKNTGIFGIESGVAAVGQRSLRATIPSGTNGDNWAGGYFGDHPRRTGGAGAAVNDVRANFRVRFGDQFEFKGGKLMILAAFEDWSANYSQPNSWSPYYLILQLAPNNVPNELEGLLHAKTSGTSQWRALRQNMGSPVRFDRGRWYEIQMRARLNDPGLVNGVFELYIDGTLKAEYTDVNFRDSYLERGWNHAILSPLQSSPTTSPAQIQLYDELILSSVTLEGGGPIGGIPSKPVGFVRVR